MKITFNPSTVAALTTPPNNKDITFDLRGRNIFARGVKFYGTDTNTWRDIKINNVSIGSYTLDLQNGSNTTLTNTNGVVTINSTWRPVVDNLTSDSTTSSLSAKQGKVLKALIDGKSNSDHNHDGRYLRLSGQDTMQGNLYLHSHGTSYIGKGLGDKSGADFTEANIVIRSWWGISFKSYDDIVRTYIDTRTGNIGTKGVLNAVGAVIQGRVYNDGDDEGIIINPAPNGCAGLILGTHNGERSVFYLKKGNPFWRYNNGSTNLDIYHPKKSGTIALTSDIPNKDSWNYDDRYLKLTGGWMSGDINFGGDYKIYWGRNTDSASISFKNDGDGDANSYMSFVTSDNGNEYFRWSHNSGSTNTEWMALKSDGLRVRGTKVSLEGHTHDDRYYTKAESNAKYITDITTSVNKLTFTRNGSNIIRDITVNVVHSQGRLTNIPNKDATTKASPGLLIYDSYNQTIGTNSYSSVLSINTGGTIQIAGDWGDTSARNLYWRSQSDKNVADYPWKSWRTILDSENYSSTLDSRYYTESEVNSLLSRKLDRVNLTTGSWNPRGYHLAADYYYNGGDLSISENNGKMYISVDGCFWQNEGQYRVLDTSDIGNIRDSVTLHQYLSATDAAWYPLVWGGNSHNNTSDSTGPVFKSYDKLSWQTSSQTLYATNIQTNNIKNLSIGGGIYWNHYVESATDDSDAASITLVRSGVAGGTTLVLSQMNDANDTIQFTTNTAARLYHNSYPILTTQNTYVSNNKGYINGTEITQVNNSDKVDNRHAISTTPNTGIIYKAAICTSLSLTSYWVRLASISSIIQNGEFVATIHVQSGHSNPGRSAILLVYLRGTASSFSSKSFKICCNSNYDPNRFRLYYKDSDKTSEIWYQTTGQSDGIITTVISQSAEGYLYEGLTLYSGSITAVQTPSMSTYLTAQVSTITDNISGNASTATKLQTARRIWGQRFDGTVDVSGTLSGVANIQFSADDTYDIGSNSVASRYIYTHWLGAKSGQRLELGANDSGFGQGLCINTNLNVGIGTNSPTQKLDVIGNIRATGQLYLPTNGNYNAILMGDDCWMGDCDISNVIGLCGTVNPNSGGIKFGKGGMYIGYNGSSHYSSGTSLWSNFNADLLDGLHSKSFAPYNGVKFGHGPDANIWHRILQFTTIWIGQVTFMYSPEECQRSYWGIFNINIRDKDIWFRGFSFADLPQIKCCGDDNNNWSVWIKGSANVYDPYGVIQILNFSNASIISVGLDKSQTTEPSGTYNKAPDLSQAGSVNWSDITNKIVAGNEFNVVNAGYNNQFWFNRLPINDRNNIATISTYCMGNGKQDYASVTASGFIKNGGNSNQFLKADGGVATFNWVAQSGQPTWLWGGNDLNYYYVYNPKNFRVSYASSAGNATTLDGMPRNHGQAPYFGTVPAIGSDGVMEIGRYIDFHYENSGSYDYSTRIQTTGNYKNIVNLPSASGTLALTSYGGDSSTPIFLGYLNLYNGGDGTISSYFSCLGHSVPFTYTRGGTYCYISIPNTSLQTFYISAAIASVHYSGSGVGDLVGDHRGDGAWWLYCNVASSNSVQVKGFHPANRNNDSWWGGNPLYSGDGAAKVITVCLFGHVTNK